MSYFLELKKSMEYLSKKSNTVFIGQAVEYPGTGMSNTLKDVNKKKITRVTSYRRNANGHNDRINYGKSISNINLSKMEFFIIGN